MTGEQETLLLLALEAIDGRDPRDCSQGVGYPELRPETFAHKRMRDRAEAARSVLADALLESAYWHDAIAAWIVERRNTVAGHAFFFQLSETELAKGRKAFATWLEDAPHTAALARTDWLPRALAAVLFFEGWSETRDRDPAIASCVSTIPARGDTWWPATWRAWNLEPETDAPSTVGLIGHVVRSCLAAGVAPCWREHAALQMRQHAGPMISNGMNGYGSNGFGQQQPEEPDAATDQSTAGGTDLFGGDPWTEEGGF